MFPSRNKYQAYIRSDGPQPHYVNIQFNHRVNLKVYQFYPFFYFIYLIVQFLAIYLDYALDESYTPSKIQIRAGTGQYDVQEVCTLDLNEPRGWTIVPFPKYVY